MDETDFSILGMLEKNSRESFVTIAKSLGITEGTVRNRVAALIRTGKIKRFTVEFEAPFEAIVMIKASGKKGGRLAAKIEEFCGNAYEISGDYDVAAVVKAVSMDDLNKKIDRIRGTKGVSVTVTAVKLR
ncbi:MAG: Lrp/AsnC family transcriptional regulator [Candidatus Aenigmarchaeota archaeon]|nr:Lrp/AsnC family transcriptional regulator [Candidatus Aenigmarchaeota archaeon]